MNLRANLRENSEGVTLVEFGLVAPILLMTIFGIFDIGHGLYMQSVLQGAVQTAGRDAGLEGGRAGQAAIDQAVKTNIQAVMPFVKAEDISIVRTNYESFSDVGKSEDFDDTNGNNTYDITECFTDRNNNQIWDSDRGVGGLGGADDIVHYKVIVGYDRIFPLWGMLNQSNRGSIQATTVMRNQPFGEQATRRSVRICP